MRVIITQRTTTTPGPAITIDCPACKSASVGASAEAVEEQNSFFWVVPFFTTRWVNVSCGACGKRFGSPRSCDELARMPRAEVSQLLATWQDTHVEFLVKFCVIVGLVLSVIPVMGLIFAAIGLAFTYRRRTTWRTLAFLGLGISILSTLLVMALGIAAHFLK